MSRNISSSNTPTILEVPSSTGFNVGDLVYNNNGNFVNGSGISQPSSINFALNANTPVTNGVTPTSVFNPIPSGFATGSSQGYQPVALLIAQYTATTGTSGAFTVTVTSATGIANGQPVSGPGIGTGATVTNVSGTTITLSVANSGTVSGNVTFYTGNVVQVYVSPNNSNYVYFTITNSAFNTTVVAATQVSSTYACSTGNLSVMALTGGGFVIYWINTSGGTTNYPTYAIYSNSGSVVTSAQQDTVQGVAAGSSSYTIRGTALANGGFVLAYAGTTALYARGYGSTGTASFSWVSFSSINVSYGWGISSRSDSSWCVVYPTTSNNTYNYSVYSSSGSSIVSTTSFTTTIGQSSGVPYNADVSVLSDGTTFVFSYIAYATGGVYLACMRLLPTGNTLGSEYYVNIANNTYASGLYGYVPIRVIALNSNNFIINQNMNCNGFWYAAFNNNGGTITCISGKASASGQDTGAFMHPLWGSTTTGATTFSSAYGFEFGGSFYFFWSPYWSGSTANYNSMAAIVNETTWAPIYQNSTSVNFGNSSGTVVSWNPTNTNPAAVTYNGNPSAASGAPTTGTILTGPIALTGASAYSNSSYTTSYDCCTLPNGTLVFCYSTGSSNGKFILSSYTQSGTLISTITFSGPSNLNSGSGAFTISTIALSSGKIAVGIGFSGTVYLYLFNSSLAALANTTLTTGTTISNQYNFNMTALTNDRYAVAINYDGSGYPHFYVYDNTNTLIANQQITNYSTGKYGVGIGTDGAGGIIMTICSASSYYYYVYYINSGGTTWTQVTASPYGSYSGGSYYQYLLNGKMASSPWGECYGVSNVNPSAGSYTYLNYFYQGLTQSYTAGYIPGYTASGGVAYQNQNHAVAINGYGYGVIAYVNNSTNNLDIYVNNGPTGSSGTGNYCSISGLGLSQSQTSGQTTSQYGASLRATAGYGNSVCVLYLDTSLIPKFVVVAAGNLYNEVISPSTTSNGVPIYPSTTSTTPAITNTTFAGVAVTSAPAGGTGQIQTTGAAKLNSNYSSTSPSVGFDFTGNPLLGAKGFMNNGVVTLQGTT